MLKQIEAGVRPVAGPAIRTAVWSYSRVLDGLADALGAEGDVAQLRGPVETCEALDIEPMARRRLGAKGTA